MAPVAKEQQSCPEDIRGSEQSAGDRIVISGMSGVFPQSHNVKEFSEVLYNKVNPVTLQDNRWDYSHPELSHYVGMAPDLDAFDAQFFAVHHRLGQHMDPISRKILEKTFEALYDAGLNPGHLYGKKVAVFIGSSYTAAEKDGFLSCFSTSGLGLLGTNKSMFANRISYWLDLKSPSVSIEESDCSSTSSLEQAYLAIKRGICEAAIVGGAQFCLHPQGVIHHGRIGAISQDGKTNSFADNCNGFTLSDTAGIFILQKSKHALRCYAELVHVKNEFVSVVNDTTGPKFSYNRNPRNSAKFIKEFYEETQVTPEIVEYVEGFGTGVPEVDKSELEAIEEAYCKNREDTLLVGSVSSNIGVTEAASGMAAITKVLLGYYDGKIAANLNCETPRRDIAALQDGRMRIVTEHQPFHRGYTAVNGLSVTGVNSHVLLKGHYKPKDLSQYKCSIPHLVLLSGRLESSVQTIIEDLKSRPVDHEEIALFHNIHSMNISGHLGRGYTILDTNEEMQTVSLLEKAEYFDEARRPLWFVYSGMGSQWPEMGAQLMRIPIFASAIERCDRVLKPKGIDIVNIITSPDKTMFNYILHAFVGIAAIQIGLTDILCALKLVPDGIIGHSVGELGCAYADGCLTAEEMILVAWCRGKVSLETTFIKGSMSAVGLGYDDISKLCPPEIDVACHNGPDSSTISGPADVMRSFVAKLTAEGIFAKEVPCANLAYHSRYTRDAGPALLKYLKEVIPIPKQRSKRWVSTSVPQDKWNEESSQYCSAEYHANNFMNPVLFNESLQLIPSNAVLVEVAPHGLLQAILKRSLPADSRNLALMQRGHSDSTLHLLKAIGNLYVGGYLPDVKSLYPKVQFPVSTETPMLSHLVEWVHSEKWNVTSFCCQNKNKKTSACTFLKSIHDGEHSYLRGNVIRDKMCYPFAAALVAVWDTFAMNAGATKRGVSVLFQDLHLYTQPLLLNKKALKLDVVFQKGSGRFEVTSEFSTVMSGYMILEFTENKSVELTESNDDIIEDDTTNMDVSSDDVYQLLKDRGYGYRDVFRSIDSADESFSHAAIVWRDNWVTFIDGILQLNVLQQPHKAVVQPAYIEEMRIDVKQHIDQVNKNSKNIKAIIFDDYTRCGGVLMKGIKFRSLPMLRNSSQIELCSTSQVKNSDPVGPNELRTTVNNKTLQSAHIGKLDSLQWVEIPQLKHSSINVKVHFAALNLLDVRRATGAAPGDTNMYGMDYSGTTHSGERVMGIVPGGAASSEVRAVPELLWPVPAHWCLEDAATVPLAYARAFYALVIRGQLKSGMCVLVHGGAGGLGQAAIAIALGHNCEVFATVSDTLKKRFLQKQFPQIGGDHIGNSRDFSFLTTVMSATKGTGCDIVLNCVKGELKQISKKCCRLFGTLLDIVAIEERENFGMSFFFRAQSYITIDFSSVFTQNNYEDMKALQRMITDGITAGYVVPLTRVTYAPQDAVQAFRLLSKSQHRGRVLLRIKENILHVEQRIICDSDQCQIMVWDNNNLAVQLTDRLINRGARNFYIYATKLTSYQRLKIRSWQQLGIRVEVSSEDLSKNESQTDFLNGSKNLGTIEGIYAVLTNTKSEHKTYNILKKFNRMSKLSPKLKYFAVVSTVKNLGQELCLSRAENGAMTTCLDISSLYEEGEVLEGLNVGDMVEQALCSSHVELAARQKCTGTPSLLEQLATLADINITENTNTNATLKELGVADEQAQWINSYLDVTYNILLDDKIIPLLTIDKINDMQKSVMETEPPSVRGLATFFNHIGSDEIVATADLILLPTLCSEVLSLDNFDMGKRYICIVPGMEGHHERFRKLCERLKLPALVLQSGFDHHHETVQETAQRYANILKKKTEVQDNFYILGYESGVMVALELASILEDQGFTGTVFCLGLAPDELQKELEEQLSDLVTQEQLEDAVIRHMYTLLTGEDTTILDNALQQADTWKLKVDTCVRHLLGRMSQTTQYARALIEAALASIQRLRCYSPKAYSLRSKLVMLRAASSSLQSSILKQYAQQSIITHQLQSPLSYVLNDVQCPSLVNQYLDDDLKKAFDTYNLCHTCRSVANSLC